MAVLRTAAKLLPPPLRRHCRNLLLDELTGWDPAAYLRSRQADLEVTLETIVSEYLRTHANIFFLQVGAFDGVLADPLYPLVSRYGLSGVLIEPQREFFIKLRANYSQFDESRFTFVNAAIAEHDGTVPLYRIASRACGPEWLHGIASFDREILMRHRATIPELETFVETENVRCLTFPTLFAEFGINHVDLLQIDAEGYDSVILHLFDIPTRKPAIVRFEHKHLTTQNYKSCLAVLINQGYKIALSHSGDTLAYHARH